MAALIQPTVTTPIPPSVNLNPNPPPAPWVSPGPSGLEEDDSPVPVDILPSLTNPIGDNALIIVADNAQTAGEPLTLLSSTETASLDTSDASFAAGPAIQTGYTPPLVAKIQGAVADSNYNQIGQGLGATPGLQGADNAIQMQSFATMVGGVLEGTVPASTLLMMASSLWHQMEFTSNAGMTVTERDGSQWFAAAPVNFAIPPAEAFGLAKLPETFQDWSNVINGAINLGPVEAGLNVPLPKAFATAAGLEPAGSATRASFLKLATDIAYGNTMVHSVGNVGGAFAHWGAAPL
jgi:hypothetical protein